MTIYLPDDLAEMVREHEDLNVSAVCQQALRNELHRREALAELDAGMERHVVYVDELGGNAAFVGRRLAYRGLPFDETAYLTAKHRIAVYSNEAQALYQYDSFDEMADEPGWRDGAPDFLAAVAAALGEDRTIELDI